MLKPLHTGFCALLALALCGCTESFKPDVSTETGNPPVIDSDKVALYVTSEEVHVRGEPGAVTPPEGQVEVRILRNGEVARGPVEGDGSFDVEVEATLDDVFEVSVVNGDTRSNTVFVVRGGAQVGEGDGGALSCEQRSVYASDTVLHAISGADRACETDDDCLLAPIDTECFKGCGFDYVSADGFASMQGLISMLNDGVCADYEDECGEVFAPPCLPPEPARCIDSLCYPNGEMTSVVDGGAMGCDTCFDNELSWVTVAAGILPALPDPRERTLSGCNTLVTLGMEEGMCSTEIPQCPIPSGPISVKTVLGALQHEDVVAAFEEGGSFGETPERTGYIYQLTLNGQTIIYNSCAGGSAGVLCEPSALGDLVNLLARVEGDNPCVDSNEPDCTSDFEAGTCEAIVPVYWHDPRTGLCVPETYGGCDGNGNNYNSFEECAAACPQPDSATSCPPNRVLVEDVCLECGLGGGCAREGHACMLVCSEDANCMDEQSPLGGEMTCEDSVCTPQSGICI